ncbi:MAG: A/G-specific adenine glycosylase [Bacteroidetes bacterium]|nr:A/G-specific adenine glycosylase [Bacteroidota bacterium]
MNSQLLLKWYEENKRDLPWRGINDPYKIWISEVILQQTRVAQGMPYYLAFVQEFPTVFDLAKATEQKVLKLWEGLGYYSRALHLLSTAKTVVKKYKGVFPEDFDELRKLKGVGDYTAAAIASFCFNKPVAVVDGNVYRVLARLFAISTPINSLKGKKEFAALAQQLLDKKNAGTYNQAIMEFGALYCTPALPDCPACIFYNVCQSGPANTALEYPQKNGGKKNTVRYFEYFILLQDDHTFVEKRTKKDIWKNLYQFPLLEYNQKPESMVLFKDLNTKILHKKDSHFKVIKRSAYKKHKLSHQTIFARFTYMRIPGTIVLQYKHVRLNDLHQNPFPVLIANEIKTMDDRLKK